MDHLTELHGTRQEAVGALMRRFATREDEVDDLFRLGVFTDLYRVVRQGVRAGSSMMPTRVRGTAPCAWFTVSCMVSSSGLAGDGI